MTPHLLKTPNTINFYWTTMTKNTDIYRLFTIFGR